MSRDDSLLNTGLSSAASRRVARMKQAHAEETAQKGAKLRPYAEIIIAEITQVRTEIGAEIANIIHLDMAEADVKATVLGLRMADAKFVSLQARLLKNLRAEEKS